MSRSKLSSGVAFSLMGLALGMLYGWYPPRAEEAASALATCVGEVIANFASECSEIYLVRSPSLERRAAPIVLRSEMRNTHGELVKVLTRGQTNMYESLNLKFSGGDIRELEALPKVSPPGECVIECSGVAYLTDRSQAMLVTNYRAGFYQRGELFILEMNRGKWKIVKRRLLWIS